MLKWILSLLGAGLITYFILGMMSYTQSLRSHGIISGRYELQLAYTNLLATGELRPNGSAKPYLYTNAVTIGGTQYQCAIAVELGHFQGAGFFAITTNHQFIFFDKRRGPIIIPPTGGYRARFFPGGM